MTTIHAFDYLDAPEKHRLTPIVVTFGDDPFLRQTVAHAARELFSGPGQVEEDPSCTLFDAEEKTLEWRDVMDELSSSSLFGSGRRLVIVQRADAFVSAQRSKLEDYVAKPRATSTLVIDVGT